MRGSVAVSVQGFQGTDGRKISRDDARVVTGLRPVQGCVGGLRRDSRPRLSSRAQLGRPHAATATPDPL
jgi:hypothetical protein